MVGGQAEAVHGTDGVQALLVLLKIRLLRNGHRSRLAASRG